MNRKAIQKIMKKIENLNYNINQQDLRDISKTLHSTREYIFLSSPHETFSRINHMLEHKTSLNKFKRAEVIQNMFSINSGMHKEFNNQSKCGKFTNM